MGLGIDVHVDMQNNDVGRSVDLQAHFGMGMGGGINFHARMQVCFLVFA